MGNKGKPIMFKDLRKASVDTPSMRSRALFELKSPRIPKYNAKR
ncbi:uncharacterized protein G2W53_026851 [Senna tora]|uniref:Uncharacterized protein n=1 Tax=Senna tora TaxID=362788 RepID=A0A834TI34_9FABA|nr:uncharacterized protein G2W53_026851 [Senna tora]